MEFESKRRPKIKPARSAGTPKADSESEDEDGNVNVEVKNVEPLLVEIEDEEDKSPTPVRTEKGGLTLPPTTTEESDRVTKEQRHISKVWEYTQAAISIAITGAVVYTQINGIESETLTNSFFFVVATYLQRTNHTRVGGSSQKSNEEVYRGR